MQNFAWDDEAEVADRAAADDMTAPELKAKLIALNPTLPVGGTKAKLVDRLVVAEQMKRALDEESDEEGSDEEPSLKDVNKSIKKLRKDVTKTLTATEGKHDFKKLDNPLKCGCLTGEGGRECGRAGARTVCLTCCVPICTKMSCLTHHANTHKGKPRPAEMFKISANEGGNSNPNKGLVHTKEAAEEEEAEEEEAEEAEEDAEEKAEEEEEQPRRGRRGAR